MMRAAIIALAVNFTTMTDSLHSHNSNPRKKASPHAASSSRSAAATWRRVALWSPPQSLGEDAQAESQETPRKPRKRLRLTRSREKMDSGSARGFATHPRDAGCGGAIHQSSVDATDVDRTGRRDVLERAEAPAPLPLDRSAADS